MYSFYNVRELRLAGGKWFTLIMFLANLLKNDLATSAF